MAAKSDRNFNRTGHEHYFWDSVTDRNPGPNRRWLKAFIAQKNRRLSKKAIKDSINNG